MNVNQQQDQNKMTDRELLELAAKAAGIDVTTDKNLRYNNFWILEDGEATCFWNPLTSDGDALRLAVILDLSIVFGANYVIVGNAQTPTVNNANDPYAATRRAIVRAAAEIGKGKL